MIKYSKISQEISFVQFLKIWIATRLLPLWVLKKNFSSTLEYFHVGNDPTFAGVEAKALCKCIILTTKKPWFMRDRRCLRQGLLAMRFLNKANLKPVIHFGIDMDSVASPSLNAHCWVEIDGKPVMNDILENMLIIHSVSNPPVKA